MLHNSKCPTQSLFFEKFAKGLLSRMGKDVRPNAGLSHLVLIQILNNIDKELIEGEEEYKRKRFLLLVAVYLVVSYVSSLRGCEGFMMERSDLVKHIDRGKQDPDLPHVVVPLLGQFKGETGERCHLLMMVNTTESGIEVRKRMERVVQLLIKEGCTSVGPVMCEADGETMLPPPNVDVEFKDQL